MLGLSSNAWIRLSLLVMTLSSIAVAAPPRKGAADEDLPIIIISPDAVTPVRAGETVYVSWLLNDPALAEEEVAITLEYFPDGNPKTGDPYLPLGTVAASEGAFEAYIPEDVIAGAYGVRADINERYFFSQMFGITGADGEAPPPIKQGEVPPAPPVAPGGAIVAVTSSSKTTTTSRTTTTSTTTTTTTSTITTRVTVVTRTVITRTQTPTTTTETTVSGANPSSSFAVWSLTAFAALLGLLNLAL
ncbi:hypothetical protein HDU96_005599 [Phlyctochytrium bullatum]|nr:hypothetical protein HDU96_005599 [Phlyctochytrium bullatum]